MKYFRLTDDVHYPERWHLGEIEEIDNWALVSTTLPAETSGNFSVKMYRPGREMDFTMNAIFSVPIVSGAFKDALAHLPGLRFLPARIEETTASRQFFLMVVDDEVDAVDESRSEFHPTFETRRQSVEPPTTHGSLVSNSSASAVVPLARE